MGLPSLVVVGAIPNAIRRIGGLGGVRLDAALYLGSAVFAAGTILMAVSANYRIWGEIAGVTYLVAGLTCLAASFSKSKADKIRIGVFIFVLIGAVLLPLGAELTLRADARPGANAQSEVAVIERAGDRVASGHDLYLSDPTSVGISPSTDQHQIDSTSYFPYLPGMAVFGLLNAVPGPAELRDARFALAGFTLAIAAVAMAISGASLGEYGRVLQVLVVLPTGALALVTGGDDLPVLALMLLSVVLAKRCKPVGAGVAMGLAAILKFTAWPLAVLICFGIRDSNGRRAPYRYGIALALVIIPVVVIGIIPSPASFMVNVVRFPLGMAKIASPAASPLLGQVLVNAFPSDKRLIEVLLVAIGAAIVLWCIYKSPPRTVGDGIKFAAFAMLLATILAPATRFGYLTYPIDLVTWAWFIDGSVFRRNITDPKLTQCDADARLDIGEGSHQRRDIVAGVQCQA